MPNAYDLVGKIDADTRAFDRKAAQVDKALRRLADSDPTVAVDADVRRAQAEIRSVEQALTGIDDETVSVLADTQSASADIRSVEAALAGIDDESVSVLADTGTALGDIQSVETALVGIDDQTVRITADTQSAAADIQSVEAALAGLEDQTVRVNTETTGMGASFGAAASQSGLLGGAVGGVIGKVGTLKAGVTGLAGGAAVAGFTKLAMGAAELDDAVNATNVVFGESRQIINDWGSRSVEAVGLSERSFRSLAAPLGALMRSLGATGDEVANMSTEVISLGADFASVLGGSTEDAVMAIGAAFRGETEPIRRYGITLDATAIQERALAMNLVDGSGKIKNRAAVIRDLIVEQAQANGIVGDFERTQREGVNAVRMMTGTISDAADKLGRAFVPMLVTTANEITDLVTAAEPLIGVLVRVGEEVDRIGQRSPARGGEGLADWIMDLLGMEKGLLEVSAAQRHAESTAAAYAARQNDLRGILERSKGPTDSMASSVRGIGDAAKDARVDIDSLRSTIDQLIGVNLSAAEADVRFAEALHRVSEAARTNGLSLDTASVAGRANQSAILDAARAAMTEVDALYRMTRETQGTTAASQAATGAIRANRQALLDQMVSMGWTTAAADQLLNRIGLTASNLYRAGEATRDTTRRTWGYKAAIDHVPWMRATEFHTPGLREANDGVRIFADQLRGLSRFGRIMVRASFEGDRGDGPGRPTGGGNTLRRARAAMAGIPGIYVTSTYRTPAQNRRVGGSPRSYHLDRANPAVDVGGSRAGLDRYVARLRSMGGWREGPIWRAPGHWDHAHVAHEGGIVDKAWPTAGVPGLRPDERPAILQVGETVTPAGDGPGAPLPYVAHGSGGGNTYVTVIVQGSMIRERDVARQIERVAGGSRRSRGR